LHRFKMITQTMWSKKQMGSEVQMEALQAPAALTLPDGAPARSAWPLQPGILHLNHGSFGGVPSDVLQHQSELKAEMERAPVPWFISAPERIGEVRKDFATRLGTEERNLAMIPNASAGASIVYSSITLPAGSDIVVTEHGYGAVTMGAERLARRISGRVITAPVPLESNSQQAHDAVMDAVTPRTALLIVDQITSPTGVKLPVVEISQSAKKAGIMVLIDGAHAPGMIDQPLQGLEADYWVGNVHKYACAPRGAALFYASDDAPYVPYPLIDSWGSGLPYPESFDHQGTLDQTGIMAAVHSWDWLENAWGWSAVREYSGSLSDYAQDIIAKAFSDVTGLDHHSGVTLTCNALRIVRLPDGLVSSNTEANSLRNLMAAEHSVHAAFTSFRGQGFVRISAHAYNTAADYEEFAERIVPVLCKLAHERARERDLTTPSGV
jgi:isopenicillin-N epimerase